MLKSVVGIAALVVLAGLASAKTLDPVNESTKDPKLAELLASLVKACDAGDMKPFEAVLAPDVLGDNEAESQEGPEAFKEYWAVGVADSPFCAQFTAAIAPGGAFVVDPDSPPTYATPYVVTNWPQELDPFNHIVAVGPATALYAKPAEGAAVLADVTHQILTVVDDSELPEGWSHVKTEDGKDGFAKGSEVRSYFEAYARFEKRGEVWMLVSFLNPKG